MKDSFRAFRITEEEYGYKRAVVQLHKNDLPEGDVLIQVLYFSLNYKDALSAIGNKGITRQYPHTPGIDAAGVVEASTDPAFAPGEEVIVTSYDLGMNTDGGFGEYIRVPAQWVVKRPEGLTLKEAMIYGIDSGQCPMDLRVEIWRRLAGDWKSENLEAMTQVIGLDELDQYVDNMLQGTSTGRLVLAHEHSDKIS